MNKESVILVVGHNDIIENTLTVQLRAQGYKKVFSVSEQNLDVLSQSKIHQFFNEQKIEYVFLGSVRSGGIEANQKFAAEFIYSNLVAQTHIIDTAYRAGVKKLFYYGSSCAYPVAMKQPIKEDSLLAGSVESTSEPYAMAKIAGIKMCQAYRQQYKFNAIVAIPATIYGPGSRVDLKTAHVLGALVGKFCDAVTQGHKEVELWGTGQPRREFLYADDFVEASIFLMEDYDSRNIINIGCGYDVSIEELADLIAREAGFKGQLIFDVHKPDGARQKLLDNTRLLDFGWKPKVNLQEGIKRTVAWYRERNNS
ncbi:MAG: GDP-L-fucose synthase [Candidatus Omnitrophica bacterium]|nr:GDP-L-fucose synthase [Candidatus Omnitrophota bacterium]